MKVDVSQTLCIALHVWLAWTGNSNQEPVVGRSRQQINPLAAQPRALPDKALFGRVIITNRAEDIETAPRAGQE